MVETPRGSQADARRFGELATLITDRVAVNAMDAHEQRGRAASHEPTRIGRFAVLRVLGEGGMGRVYSAYDEQLDRRVAVKVLRREVDDPSRQRVIREAKAMARLSHPNVVQVFEVGEHDGSLFIAMEFVAGETLGGWQAARGRGWTEVLQAYTQAGQGLAAAHDAGLIHRDFKPANAMVDSFDGRSPRVRVLDFGLARLSEGSETMVDSRLPATQRRDDGEPTLTARGGLLGTPAYMAPEQFASASVDALAGKPLTDRPPQLDA